ncbi:hypothetical protein [Streptomyces sp. NPDC047841]|uniref:hypothetical protein n=1 Tax=Streptomyces sp. NPDC047841 TaxID=3154708 RepID=UPI0034555380
MPEHATTLQLIGLAVLGAAAVVWAVVLLRLLRRAGRRTVVRRSTAPLPALPSQTRVGPSRESVELTPAEQDAFAGLVRHLANG